MAEGRGASRRGQGRCGRYNQFDAWVTPNRIWREIVLANFIKL